MCKARLPEKLLKALEQSAEDDAGQVNVGIDHCTQQVAGCSRPACPACTSTYSTVPTASAGFSRMLASAPTNIRCSMRLPLLMGLLLLPILVRGQDASAEKERVYFGTYTGKGSDGIYVADFDPATGLLGDPKLAAKTVNPSFLALHPNRRYLYAVNEVGSFQNKPTGAVTAFAIDADTGLLRVINSQSSRARDRVISP